ncbi:MAG: 3-deoxy-8-phosphooctulonate synthase [Candidatus Kapabacteria bacterium]|nr:3-deoxy-8-phosphooctulonate synthase [Candidatus Kapabacteria bacterium]
MQATQQLPIIIAGPCLVESRDLIMRVAEHLAGICSTMPVELVLKGSYRKANRTSAGSFSGIGDEQALGFLQEAGRVHGLRTLTDIHSDAEAAMAAEFVDVLQIPAFLSRQTSLLQAAAATGRTVNIKKAQFMAPDDMAKAAEKVTQAGNPNVWLTERGTSFGYHDLVVDFRSLVIMRQTGLPVIFDATHSVQQPSIGAQSGGRREFIPALARAAAAVGIDGIFVETHPDPASALSDAATQLPLEQMAEFLAMVLDHWHR